MKDNNKNNDINNNNKNEDSESLSNAAKLLKAMGEKNPESEQEHEDIPLAKGKWWENFLYHYKWHTIVIAFVTVFLVVSITQLVSKETPDVYVMYAGPYYINSDKNTAVRNAVRQVMSEDYNGDGEKGVMLTDLTFMNDAQVKLAYDEAKQEGVDIAIDMQNNATALERFNMEAFSGESVVYFLDPELYESVKLAGGFLTLEEVLGYVPDSAVDEYGIRLCDIPFGQYFDGVNSLPEETILCIRRVSTMSFLKGQKKTERIHSYHVQLFKDIVNFDFPEGYVPPAES